MDVANCMICGLNHKGYRLADPTGGPDRFVCLVCADEIWWRHDPRRKANDALVAAEMARWSPPRPEPAPASMDETSS